MPLQQLQYMSLNYTYVHIGVYTYVSIYLWKIYNNVCLCVISYSAFWHFLLYAWILLILTIFSSFKKHLFLLSITFTQQKKKALNKLICNPKLECRFQLHWTVGFSKCKYIYTIYLCIFVCKFVHSWSNTCIIIYIQRMYESVYMKLRRIVHTSMYICMYVGACNHS